MGLKTEGIRNGLLEVDAGYCRVITHCAVLETPPWYKTTQCADSLTESHRGQAPHVQSLCSEDCSSSLKIEIFPPLLLS